MLFPKCKIGDDNAMPVNEDESMDDLQALLDSGDMEESDWAAKVEKDELSKNLPAALREVEAPLAGVRDWEEQGYESIFNRDDKEILRGLFEAEFEDEEFVVDAHGQEKELDQSAAGSSGMDTQRQQHHHPGDSHRHHLYSSSQEDGGGSGGQGRESS